MVVNMFAFVVSLLTIQTACSFHNVAPTKPRSLAQSTRASRIVLAAEEKDGESGGVEEYKNAATSILSNFMRKNKMEEAPIDPLANIDFDAPKIGKKNLDTLASMLDKELYEKEWFVTGQVNPSFFADDFEFNDPDVKLSGIEGTWLVF